MQMTCKCGSKKFHTFFEHKTKNTRGVRCLNCGRTYEFKGDKRTEINLSEAWDNIVLVRHNSKSKKVIK